MLKIYSREEKQWTITWRAEIWYWKKYWELADGRKPNKFRKILNCVWVNESRQRVCKLRCITSAWPPCRWWRSFLQVNLTLFKRMDFTKERTTEREPKNILRGFCKYFFLFFFFSWKFSRSPPNTLSACDLISDSLQTISNSRVNWETR